MRFVTSIIHSVNNIAAAESFFCRVLGFNRSQHQGHRGLLLENGSVTVRLIDDVDAPLKSLNLEMYSKQLEQDSNTLLNFPELRLLSKNVSINPYRLETRLQAPYSVVITLYQEFNEDDLGILLPLATALDWEEQAIDCIQQLLTYVPLDFRQLARDLVIERAEVLAAEQGKISVTLSTAVQALAETAPHFQHSTLVCALRERGIDPGQHFKESLL